MASIHGRLPTENLQNAYNSAQIQDRFSTECLRMSTCLQNVSEGLQNVSEGLQNVSEYNHLTECLRMSRFHLNLRQQIGEYECPQNVSEGLQNVSECLQNVSECKTDRHVSDM